MQVSQLQVIARHSAEARLRRALYPIFKSKAHDVPDILEKNECDFRVQHGRNLIFPDVPNRFNDFCFFTMRTMHPSGQC